MRATFSGWLLAIAVALAVVEHSAAQEPPARYNVLFIAVGDLAPRLGCYGDALAQTPNIDRLARQGLLFERAYCQQALCSPSRTSLLTGRRPETTKVSNLTTHFRQALPDVVTLPQQFKKHGYHTQALGKIYHAAFLTRKGEGGPKHDDAPSWSAPWWAPQPHYYHSPHGIAIAQQWFARTHRKSGAEIEQWKDEIIRGLPGKLLTCPIRKSSMAGSPTGPSRCWAS